MNCKLNFIVFFFILLYFFFHVVSLALSCGTSQCLLSFVYKLCQYAAITFYVTGILLYKDTAFYDIGVQAYKGTAFYDIHVYMINQSYILMEILFVIYLSMQHSISAMLNHKPDSTLGRSEITLTEKNPPNLKKAEGMLLLMT